MREGLDPPSGTERIEELPGSSTSPPEAGAGVHRVHSPPGTSIDTLDDLDEVMVRAIAAADRADAEMADRAARRETNEPSPWVEVRRGRRRGGGGAPGKKVAQASEKHSRDQTEPLG